MLYALALGSNRWHGRYGAPKAVIDAAIADLSAQGLTIKAQATIFETQAVGPAGRRFANTAIIVQTTLLPLSLLALCKKTEQLFGRRAGRRWGARVLDIDILLWEKGRWPQKKQPLLRYRPGLTSNKPPALWPTLHIPHLEISRRDFVLKPLTEIAGNWRVFEKNRFFTVKQLYFRYKCLTPKQ
ncbi:MAG: 2-amino-4-hydroxy-6-hydroxymethyldihydropteridine diphosphokinase [Zymomonas mobilis subsp. pomaceae]|uniref:2-amino-4-hydroxy-6-hydroxymethyldihydropteridine pyrophosphokinase n=1 Tax=Zymomonas mobilis subsp. pomaceae (strain ATCC 29192 / DSM 22645 / JCM 10191 / CCUG 17912 / NBRC 13757 / NCIMB 11200 / NRRL B-4491 / Barker I) TaxID=579138 RepID=F8EVM1_ZYMMT|nr:2-amino-4-hydroxy-6-hydroxymethyldihydropteridine diphosphokinase [Zymomonas mobilis]AEI38358.1 2-amino-4-hydroxy-6-hydroxymethyldihydropteridine pyrophosphokinase [Zymomonas mobilis subsp. pomaceae ATCC 29192]MDX5948047.1 2-amino-4-hydroxy-6-hydroxymethyldihydropteridine diphosphokinase [Zymomonas mobilis subsp. pomaceae]GEB89377.1 2-amino-4-hydroxy-6-hydroxymethyldihydropteridine diphosphokinase [Zymomonas mobilis subsp. pomaceae]